MQYILSHYGLRLVQHALRTERLDRDEVQVLCAVLSRSSVSRELNPSLEPLLQRGWLDAVDDDFGAAAIQLRYARNPLEHITRVVFEYTTLCNLDCLHCRNTNLEARADTDPAALRRVVDAVLPLGIDRFDFIGGEVTMFGKGWLELVEHIRAQGGAHISVITSGWFLGQQNFLAAGKRYTDDRAYFEELRARGQTHVIFSLDGPEDIHDRCRQVPGLYRRVIDGFEKVRAAGLEPRVSLVVGMGIGPDAAQAWIADISRRIYGPAQDQYAETQQLLGDESNYASNFIDVGGGAQLVHIGGGRGRGLSAFSDEDLRCKNFYRPAPTLRIKASGEIALCPLIEGGDGYGNVRERDVVELLNHFSDAFVYRLHAENRAGEYRRFVDAEIFESSLAHACGARVAINMIARTMFERGVREDDHATIRAINIEVAEKMGVLPRALKHRANGHARSY